MRYQIRVLDGDLIDIVQEIATQVSSQVVAAASGQVKNFWIYPKVFGAVKEQLKGRVRAFHVCGCAQHCNESVTVTELSDPTYDAQDFSKVDLRSKRVHRYVLELDVSLSDFAEALEAHIVDVVRCETKLAAWHVPLFNAIKNAVEPVLGRYLYYSDGCNQENFLCEVGACTEFDPWERVALKEKAS